MQDDVSRRGRAGHRLFTACRSLRPGRVALTLAAAFLLGVAAGSPAALAQAKVPAGTARFMAFPSNDPSVRFNQAWYYEASGLKNNYCSYPGGDIKGYGRHCAIDFSKRNTAIGANVSFPVTAVADGWAYLSGAMAGMALVEHDQKDATGRRFCTRYLHLDTHRHVLPRGKKIRVRQGQLIGWAGKTGTRAIHLHFDVRVGGCAGQRVDPYDIAAGLLARHVAPVKTYYPRGAKFKGCGPNQLWKSCNR